MKSQVFCSSHTLRAICLMSSLSPGSRVAVESEDGVWRLGRVLAMRPGQMFSVRLDTGGQVITVTYAVRSCEIGSILIKLGSN